MRRKLGQGFSAWVPCGSFVRQAAQQWFGRVLCWQEETSDSYLSALWEPHYREACLLITHERTQRKVLRSKTPQGVRQELYGIYLAHYAVRVLLAQAAVEEALDPDRLSFSEGLFELTEMLSLALTVEPEEASALLLKGLRQKMARHVLPPRRLRINRRELKQIYQKYKPKKPSVPAPEPFNPGEQFLDFVDLLDPLAPALPIGGP